MEFAPLPGTLVIGFGHKARHGKDSAARALVETYPGLVQRFSFADDLYAVCRIVHGMSTKDAPLLQRVGVAERARDADVWVRAVYHKIRDARPPIAVITDVRFENEAAFVRSLGGVLVKVQRVTPDGVLFVAPDRDPQHVSEIALDGYAWDRCLTNLDGMPASFRADVLHFMRTLARDRGIDLTVAA